MFLHNVKRIEVISLNKSHNLGNRKKNRKSIISLTSETFVDSVAYTKANDILQSMNEERMKMKEAMMAKQS